MIKALQVVVASYQLSEIKSASPEVRLYHTIQALVKGPRGEIAGPVVVFTVCVGKEISAEHRELSGSGSLGHSVRFVHSIEVVCESPKLSLEDTDGTKHTLYSNTAEQKRRRKEKCLIIGACGFHLTRHLLKQTSSRDRFFVLSAS